MSSSLSPRGRHGLPCWRWWHEPEVCPVIGPVPVSSSWRGSISGTRRRLYLRDQTRKLRCRSHLPGYRTQVTLDSLKLSWSQFGFGGGIAEPVSVGFAKKQTKTKQNSETAAANSDTINDIMSASGTELQCCWLKVKWLNNKAVVDWCVRIIWCWIDRLNPENVPTYSLSLIKGIAVLRQINSIRPTFTLDLELEKPIRL